MGQKRHELVSVPVPIQLVQSLMCLHLTDVAVLEGGGGRV